jgi:hypothetical protein
MSAQRVVAELGRPETPEETAARKAESSRVYRSSQNFRNLIAARASTPRRSHRRRPRHSIGRSSFRRFRPTGG